MQKSWFFQLCSKLVLMIIKYHISYVEVFWRSKETISGHQSYFRPLSAKWQVIFWEVENPKKSPKNRFGPKIQISIEWPILAEMMIYETKSWPCPYVGLGKKSLCMKFGGKLILELPDGARTPKIHFERLWNMFYKIWIFLKFFDYLGHFLPYLWKF